jgi:hypothetical protein
VAIGGAFVPNVACGSGQACAGVPGACCLPGGQGECEQVTELTCTSFGGDFHPVVQCDPGLCMQPATCLCDLNGDGAVGFADLTQILLNWGPAQPDDPADLNEDGLVGFSDMTQILIDWGPC